MKVQKGGDNVAAPDGQYGTWFVHIPNWHPTRLNQLLNSHWAVAARYKRHDADIIAASVLGAGVPKADRSRRRVSVEIVLGPRQRGGDPDCYWKSLLDGLVKCGLLKDDSKEWLECGEVIFSRGPRPATVIKIENFRPYLDAIIPEKGGEVRPRKAHPSTGPKLRLYRGA